MKNINIAHRKYKAEYKEIKQRYSYLIKIISFTGGFT